MRAINTLNIKNLVTSIVLMLVAFWGYQANAAEADGTVKWHYSLINFGNNIHPAMGPDGTIYITDLSGGLHAINQDGTAKWVQYNVGCEVDFSCVDYSGGGSPTVDADGTIYINGGKNSTDFVAINPDGSLKWSFSPGGGQESFIYAAPSIGRDGTIYVNGNIRFYALNPDGTQKWSFLDGSTNYGPSAIAADGTVYVYNRSKIYALNPDGSKKWQYPETNELIVFKSSFDRVGPVIGADGTIYVPAVTQFERFLALNPDGTKKWGLYPNNKLFSTDFSSPAAIGKDGIIYINGAPENLYAISPEGVQIATVGTATRYSSGIQYSPAIAADGTIYVAREFAGFDALNPDGSFKWIFATSPSGAPLIGENGNVYLSAGDGLYALNDNNGGVSDSPWPMHGKNPQHTSRVETAVTAPPLPPVMSYSTPGTSISITWNSVAGATGYILSYAPYPYTGPQSIGSIDLGNQTSFSYGLWSGAAFYIAVQAYNDQGTSSYSNIEYFIIP